MGIRSDRNEEQYRDTVQRDSGVDKNGASESRDAGKKTWIEEQEKCGFCGELFTPITPGIGVWISFQYRERAGCVQQFWCSCCIVNQIERYSPRDAKTGDSVTVRGRSR